MNYATLLTAALKVQREAPPQHVTIGVEQVANTRKQSWKQLQEKANKLFTSRKWESNADYLVAFREWMQKGAEDVVESGEGVSAKRRKLELEKVAVESEPLIEEVGDDEIATRSASGSVPDQLALRGNPMFNMMLSMQKQMSSMQTQLVRLQPVQDLPDAEIESSSAKEEASDAEEEASDTEESDNEEEASDAETSPTVRVDVWLPKWSRRPSLVYLWSTRVGDRVYINVPLGLQRPDSLRFCKELGAVFDNNQSEVYRDQLNKYEYEKAKPLWATISEQLFGKVYKITELHRNDLNRVNGFTMSCVVTGAEHKVDWRVAGVVCLYKAAPALNR